MDVSSLAITHRRRRHLVHSTSIRRYTVVMHIPIAKTKKYALAVCSTRGCTVAGELRPWRSGFMRQMNAGKRHKEGHAVVAQTGKELLMELLMNAGELLIERKV